MSDDEDDTLTPDQRAADIALHDAIALAVRAYDLLPDNAVTSAWVVNFLGVSFDKNGRLKEHSGYVLPENGKTMSNTLLLGISAKAYEFWKDQAFLGDDDDDEDDD